MQTESPPPLSEYISHVKSLPRNERYRQAYSDIGVKFPKLQGTIELITSVLTPQHTSQAKLVEETQSWGHSGKYGVNNGFIVFQNRTYQQLKSIVLEVQAQEGSCDNMGNVYYMNLSFDQPAPSTAVVGVTFSFPTYIQSGHRCINVVDLIYQQN